MARRKGEPVIGIDLGRIYSCVGVWKSHRVNIIENDLGIRTTPSCVAFTNTQMLIGEMAIDQALSNPSYTIYDMKRLIGRRFSDASVQSDAMLWPFDVVAGPGDKPPIPVRHCGKILEFSAEEISAIVIGKMKEMAEAYLGQKVMNVVVTVPAYFNNSQRQATIAGLNVIRIINEPTAAAITYMDLATDWSSGDEKTVLVFNLGGKTTDASIISIKQGVLEVKATTGDTNLGGDDFTNKLFDHCVEECRQMHNMEILGTSTDSHEPLSRSLERLRRIRRLKTACEQSKKELSYRPKVFIEVDGLFLDSHPDFDFSTTVSLPLFQQLSNDLFLKCLEPVRKCLNDAKIDKSKIDDVVLTGGSTRMPGIKQLLEAFFNGKKLCRHINPDEAVAYGATIQAAILMGEKQRDILLHRLDVTALSLGTSVVGELMSVMIPRNTRIPVRKEQCFTTTVDNQATMTFQVLEGERAMSKDNILRGNLTLSGIGLAPKGVPSVMMCFDIDEDGILTVSAEDMKTGVKNRITITTNDWCRPGLELPSRP